MISPRFHSFGDVTLKGNKGVPIVADPLYKTKLSPIPKMSALPTSVELELNLILKACVALNSTLSLASHPICQSVKFPALCVNNCEDKSRPEDIPRPFKKLIMSSKTLVVKLLDETVFDRVNKFPVNPEISTLDNKPKFGAGFEFIL